MMDLCMVLVLAACFLSMKWFADWCEKQVKTSATASEVAAEMTSATEKGAER